MTRVLHVSQATTEGVGRCVDALIVDQTQRGWAVSLACPSDVELEAACAAQSVDYHRWSARRAPGPTLMREVRELGRIIANVDPDVVHLHASKAGLAGRLALRGRRATVFTPHAWSFLAGGPITRLLARRWERFATRWTDILLCVGGAERTRGEDAGLVGTWRIVPNAVDLDTFTAATSSERAAARRALEVVGPTVVCVGRLTEQKGQDLLVALWPSVRAAVPDAALVLVGDGPSRAALERAAGPGVRFVGAQDNVRSWVIAADVVAMPSRWEGLSLVILEALACGSSIVASTADGMREAVGDGDDAAGALVALKPPAELRDAIVARLQAPELVAVERERATIRSQQFASAGWGDRIAEVLIEASMRPVHRDTR